MLFYGVVSDFLDEAIDLFPTRAAAVAELGGGSHAEPEAEPWRLLTVQDVCQRLSRSERWVRERAKRGELPWIMLDGGALAFDLEDVRAFARARRVPEA